MRRGRPARSSRRGIAVCEPPQVVDPGRAVRVMAERDEVADRAAVLGPECDLRALRQSGSAAPITAATPGCARRLRPNRFSATCREPMPGARRTSSVGATIPGAKPAPASRVGRGRRRVGARARASASARASNVCRARVAAMARAATATTSIGTAPSLRLVPWATTRRDESPTPAAGSGRAARLAGPARTSSGRGCPSPPARRGSRRPG